MNRFQSRTDKVNIDRVSDALVPANDEVLTYTDAGRLASAASTGTYGTRAWTYDESLCPALKLRAAPSLAGTPAGIV